MARARFLANRVGPARRAAISAGLRSLRVHILLWTILPIAIFVLGLSFTDVYGHQQAMRAMVQQRDDALAQSVAARIGEDLAHQAARLQALTLDPAFAGAPASAQARLLAPLDATFVDGVALLDGDGALRAASGDLSWRDEPFVRSLLQAAHSGGRPAYLATPQGSLAVAVPLPDGAATLVGLSPLSASAIVAGVDALRVTPQAAARLLDEAGTPIYGAGAATDVHGEEGIVTAVMPVPGTGWRVELAEPWHGLVPLVLRYAQATVLIAAAAALIALLSVYSGVRYVTRPLQALGQRARRVAWGDFDAVAEPVGGVEEIADLQRALQQMAAQVRSYQAAMRSYAGAVTQAQEEERLRLARELHDDTVQSLIALGQQMERVQKGCAPAGGTVAAQLAELRQEVRCQVQDLRRLIGDLRPLCLDDLGLGPALEALLKELPPALHAGLAIAGEERRLSPDIELAVYRIVQAALKNVEQHSAAQHVSVRLTFEAQAVRAVVEDDGAGFAPPDAPDDLAREGHFGLLGMRERAMLAAGQLTLSAAPGRGTRVEACLPLQPHKPG